VARGHSRAPGRHRPPRSVSAAGTVRFRFVLFRSRGRSTAGSNLVHSRPAPTLLIRSPRIVVTVIAAIENLHRTVRELWPGRPLRTAAVDAVQSPTRSGRAGRRRPL